MCRWQHDLTHIVFGSGHVAYQRDDQAVCVEIWCGIVLCDMGRLLRWSLGLRGLILQECTANGRGAVLIPSGSS